MKILVIGATGMLGAPVAQALQAAGHTTRVLSRDPQKARARLGETFEFAAGDVENPASLEAALQGCEAVHINLEGGSDPDLERRGVQNALDAARKAGARRVSYISGASVSAENTWYAGTKAKFEAEAAIRASGLEYAIFKPTFFMETLPRFVRDGRASILGSQPNPLRWVAAPDYARMVAKSFAIPNLKKEFYIYGPQAMTMIEALQAYCDAAHPGLKVGSLPFWMAGLLAMMPGAESLKAAIPFFRYIEKVREAGSPEEANALLGAPTTRLETWLRGLKSNS